LSVVGGYDNLKGLLGRIRGLKRFSQFSLLTIKTLLKEDQSVSDSLQMDLVLNFNYLNEPKRVASGDLSNEIFSKESFDRQPIEAIKNSRSINVSNVLPGQRRGSNPFFIAK
jgi:hypothetical protein